MVLTIKSIHFKNFLSYGEQMQGYVFAKGLTSISAPSGYGKSVLLEALSYALYGQPYRDIKMDDLINRTNKTGMMTICEFETNGIEYKITRGRKPDVLEVEKNGQKMDKASSINLTQEALAKIIGIDYDMFRRVLCISTVNNSPFLDSSKESKRKAKDQLFNLETLGLMLRKAKEEATQINTNYAVCENAMELAEDEHCKAEAALNEHCKRVASFEKDKAESIKALENDKKESLEAIKRLEEDLAKAEARKKKIARKMEELSIDKANDENAKLNLGKMNLKEKMGKAKEFIEKGEGTCEACGQPIGEECIANARKQLKSYAKELEGLEKELEPIREIQENHREGMKLLAECDSAIGELKSNLGKMKDSVEFIDKQIGKEIERAYPDNESARKRSDEAREKLNAASARLTLSKNAKELNKAAQKVLGDDGVKKAIISTILPMFNSMVAVNCQRFGLPMSVEFDEKMEETVTECGKEYPYKGCSEGEKARLNLAIQMSMLEISRAISGWDCNLIVLDEILDNSLDVASIIRIVDYLRERCSRTDSSVIVISHKLADNPNAVFDKVYRIDKQFDFSMIRE